MSNRRELFDHWGNPVRSPNKRSRRNEHQVLDSDEQGSDGKYDESVSDRFRDPLTYLRTFGSYESDSEDENAQFSHEEEEEEEDENWSEDEDKDDEARSALKRFIIPKLKKPNTGFDFSTLPVIDNDGLRYLPRMYYFLVGEICPVKPQNKVEGEALSVLIQHPNGGINCISIPFETVEENKTE
jgi:hypothetical protein